MIKCVSIDGVDGSGKTTLANELSKYFNTIQVPRYYFSGMVPTDSNERTIWFRTEDAVKTTDIYISGQKIRYLLAREFKKGFHYKAFDENKPSLVVIDRGELSLKAFSYAALKKGTKWSSDEIKNYLETRFNTAFEHEIDDIIDYSFLLFKENTINTLFSRRFFDSDDMLLATYQQEYYEKCTINKSKVKTISPLESKENILEIVISKIVDIGV